VSTSRTTTEQHEPSILRSRLADQLVAAGHVRTAAVEAAFRTVPRHAFAPEVPVETAYTDDVIPTRHTPDGRISSSVSAPWLQADMLEAARLRPGHHVLEIGSGGYNAALIAELVGPTGSVTTVDIDAVVTDRATGCLKATGYDHVRVITADAAHLPPDAVPAGSFDAVIVTVDTWDLPWIGLVADGGRLVAPLRIHQYVWSIGFTKRDGELISDEPLTVCGFVPMQGAGAWNTNHRTVPRHGIHLAFEDGTPQPVDRLASAFDRPRTEVRTNVTVGGEEPFDSLNLYLAGALPGFCRLAIDPDHDTGIICPPPPRTWPAAAIVRGNSLARLAHDRIGDDERGKGVYEFVIHGYGPAGRQGSHRDGRTGPALAARPPCRHLPAHHRSPPNRRVGRPMPCAHRCAHHREEVHATRDPMAGRSRHSRPPHRRPGPLPAAPALREQTHLARRSLGPPRRQHRKRRDMRRRHHPRTARGDRPYRP
jgi:methyltransferase of FxLD system